MGWCWSVESIHIQIFEYSIRIICSERFLWICSERFPHDASLMSPTDPAINDPHKMIYMLKFQTKSLRVQYVGNGLHARWWWTMHSVDQSDITYHWSYRQQRDTCFLASVFPFEYSAIHTVLSMQLYPSNGSEVRFASVNQSNQSIHILTNPTNHNPNRLCIESMYPHDSNRGDWLLQRT